MKEIESVTVGELTTMAERMYGNLVKAVVDIQRQDLVVDMEMHVDGERLLLEQGSKQPDLWGINLHPAKFGTDEFIEFDSMINIRPSQSNLSRDIGDEVIRAKIRALVQAKVTP